MPGHRQGLLATGISQRVQARDAKLKQDPRASRRPGQGASFNISDKLRLIALFGKCKCTSYFMYSAACLPGKAVAAPAARSYVHCDKQDPRASRRPGQAASSNIAVG